MLYQFFKAVQLSFSFPLHPILIFSLLLILAVPVTAAQSAGSEETAGEISGTVLWSRDNSPAAQVMVSVKSDPDGVSRTVLTDFEGHFAMGGLAAGTFNVVAEEAGFDPAISRVHLDGGLLKIVLRLKAAAAQRDVRSAATVSVHQLRIPDKARDEYQHGLQSLTKNDLADALKRFTKANKDYPGFYEAEYQVGFTQLKMGNQEEAMKAFQQAFDVSEGRYAPAELGFGALLYESGKLREAETVIRRGVELDDTLAEGYALLGMVLMREQRPDEAEKSVREALLRKATFAQAYLVLSDVHASRHDYQAQVRDLDTYLALEPKGPERARVLQAREFVVRRLAGGILQAGIPAH